MLTLTIHKRLTVDVADLANASREYAQARELSNAGSSKFPVGVITQDGREVAYVSYNGNVWATHPSEWQPGFEPLYRPTVANLRDARAEAEYAQYHASAVR